MGSTTGSIILMKKGKQVTAGITAPSNPKINEIWLDTAENANILKYWNGTSWIKVNDVSDEFSDIYETLRNNYYTRTETSNQIATQIGSATITTSDGTTINMKNALNEVIDTSMEHTQTISSMQSDIDKNENALNTLQTSVSTFTHDLDGFKLDVSKTYATKDEFDNLEIGGRNLVVQNTLTRNKYLTINGTEEESPYFAITDFIDIGDAKQLVYTTDNYGIAPSTCFYDENKNFIIGYSGENRKLLDVPNSAKYVRTTVPLAGLNVTKLEKGSIATDWTPAPEDIENEFLSVQSSITQNADKIALVVSGTDKNGSVILTDNALNVITDNIDLTGKVTFNSLDTSMKNTVNHVIEAADTANTKIDNLEITGTNLLRNYNQYTENNKRKLTATNDNYFEITNASVILEEGKQYTFSCKTDGIWGTGTDDTVEAYLLLNKQYQTFFRLDSNKKFTFTAPASGEYYLRIDVNKNGISHLFWNFKIEKGNQATNYSPNPMDMADLHSIIFKWTNEAASDGTTAIQGGWIDTNTITADKIAANTITSDKIATGTITAASGIISDINADVITSGTLKGITIQSTNYTEAVGTLNPLTGSKLNLADGSFKSRNLQWDSNGNVICNNIKATLGTFSGKITADSGRIGDWEISSTGGLMSEYSTNTAPGTLNRFYLQPYTKKYYEDTWMISSQYFNIDSSGTVNDKGYAYWYITGWGDFYTGGDIDAQQITAQKGITSTGRLMLYNGGFELYAATPYIDFHAGNSDADYTARIINTSGGTLLAYNTISNVSDRRLKKDIAELDNRYINVLKSMKPVSYRFIKGDKYLNIGFIAQDVEQSFLKNGITDIPLISKENDDIYALDYNQITALCVMGYQSHETRIMELENKLAIANALIQELVLRYQNEN